MARGAEGREARRPGASPTMTPPDSTRDGLTRSVGIVGLATMISRVLGLVRDQALAYRFGAGDRMDAFFVALRIPNLLRELFAEGAMNAAFVPVFTRRLTREGREAAWRLGAQLINALAVVTGVIAAAGIIFAEPLTRLFAAGYQDVPGKLELTVQLTRIVLPFFTLVAIAAACMGMLNSLRRFFVPALSPAAYNVCLIAGTLVVVPLMPEDGMDPIAAVAAAVLAGGAGQIAAQWWALRREGFRWRPVLDPGDRGLREVVGLMGPATVAGAALQVNLFVNTRLATFEGTGAVTWLTHAFRLMYLPLGVLGVSIATVTLPAVSRHAAAGDLAAVRETVSRGLRLMLAVMVPAAVGLALLATPVVRLVLEHGEFSAADTTATARALVFYAPGIVGYAAVRLTAPVFYAFGNSLAPAGVSVATVAANVGLNLVLVRIMGYPGLALGTTLASVLNASALLVLLHRRLGGIDGGRLADRLGRICLAAGVMGAAVAAAEGMAGDVAAEGGLLTAGLVLGGEIALGLIVLAAAARLLGIAELDEVRAQVLGRLLAGRPSPGAGGGAS